jgi:cytochrome c553
MLRTALFLAALPALVTAAGLSPDQSAFFESRIRPVLASSCYDCHGPEKQKGGLRVDWRDALLKGGDSGPAIVPGNPDDSLLIKAISGQHPELRMPENADPLPALAIENLRSWIRDGAPDPRTQPSTNSGSDWSAAFALRRQWWCWQPLQNPSPPESSGSLHPIDRFLRKPMQDADLTPAPTADPGSLIRRASFVLTGLPPSPAETESFLTAWKDESSRPATWAALIDRFLQSPAFGERWARHWMDWTRYADSHGSEGDPAVPYAWQYRDYLIRALNDDIPYFQLLREHLAGDLMPPRPGRNPAINEAAIGPAHLRMVFHGFTPTDALDEFVTFTDNQVDVVSKAFLGLTVSCARCHHHKFDAISQEDYYAMFGVFANSRPGIIDASTNTAQPSLAAELHQQKAAILSSVLEGWSSLADPAAALANWEPADDNQRKAAAADGLGPLGPWLQLRDIPPDAMATAWSDLQKRQREAIDRQQAHQSAPARFRWTPGGHTQDKVFTHGPGLTTHSRETLFTITDPPQNPPIQLRPDGRFSDSLSRRHRGIFQSARFKSEGGRLWVRACGRNASLRFVVHHYPRAGLIYPKTGLDHDEPRWISFDMDYWKGETVYVEAVTNPDHPAETAGGERAWFGISEILYPQDAATTPPAAPDILTLLLKGPAPRSRGELLDRYRDALRILFAQLSRQPASPEAAAFLNFACRSGLLPLPADALAATTRKIAALRETENSIPEPVRVPGVLEADAADWTLYTRGDIRKPSQPVPRAFLSALDPSPWNPKDSGRRELADSIASKGRPLALRVIANRLWHHCFGRGIVPTTDNFGKLGELPSHPELLDWLAGELDRNSGSLKATLRTIVTSHAFMASSAPSAEASERDPQDRLLSHWPLRRLEAEAIRDSMLTMTGRLTTGGGPGQDGSSPVRSVYVRVIRNALDPFLTAFDAPVPSSTRGNRDSTSVPAQALTLMNSQQVQSWAADWANRIAAAHKDPPSQIRQLFLEAFQREPSPQEAAESLAWLASSETAILAADSGKSRLTAQLAETEAARARLINPVIARLRKTKPTPESSNAPKPLAEWDFTTDAPPAIPLKLHGGATLRDGSLHLNGSDAFASTGPLPFALRARTLEAWLSLATTNQSGGGVFTIQDLGGDTFDAIVFAERDPAQWIAGSNVFARTQPVGGPPETETNPVHIAITWADDGTIRIFRNGQPYGQPYRSSGPVTFAAGQSMIQFGCRHGSPSADRILKGSIHRARLHSRALTETEIAASASLEGSIVTPQAIQNLLSAEEQQQLAKIDAATEQLRRAIATAQPSAITSPLQSLTLALLNTREFISLR